MSFGTVGLLSNYLHLTFFYSKSFILLLARRQQHTFKINYMLFAKLYLKLIFIIESPSFYLVYRNIFHLFKKQFASQK